MRLLWTKSNSPLSIAIRTITGDDCSHFSFVFESPGRAGTMYESNLLGTHPAFLKTALKSHVIVHELDIALSDVIEDQIWNIVQDKYDGKPYDFLGAIYLGWRKLLYRALRVAVPLKNKWAQPGQYFCDEIYEILNNIDGFKKVDVTSGMDTPHDVWLKLNEGTK